MIAVRTCENKQVTPCNSFKYLGSVIDATTSSTTEIRRRLNIALSTFGSMNRIWKAKTLSRKVKAALYQAIIMSIMLYNAEVWPIKTADLKKLESSHFRMMRSMLTVEIDEHIGRDEAIKKSGLYLISDYISEKRMRWIGHAVRRRQDDRSKIAVMKALREKKWTKVIIVENATSTSPNWNLAQDRKLFRALTFRGGARARKGI